MKIPKLKAKAFSIDLGIYPYTLFVCFKDLNKLEELLKTHRDGCEAEVAIEVIQKINLYVKENCCVGCASEAFLPNGNLIIYFPNLNLKNMNYFFNMIPHEAFHITEMVLSNVGIPLTKSSDEAYAYLTGYINEQIFKQI
jgi:hypothetical protein